MNALVIIQSTQTKIIKQISCLKLGLTGIVNVTFDTEAMRI